MGHSLRPVDRVAELRTRKGQSPRHRQYRFPGIDYFRPPFNHNVPLMLCCDTLIRGPVHEKMLLESIKNSIAPGGRRLVDFHNWWHNPIRRMKLLKQNFPTQGSYTRKQTDELMRVGGLEFEYFPFFQEFEQSGIVGKIGAKILPPTRHSLTASARAHHVRMSCG